MQPLVVLNTVGLTYRHLQHAPRLSALAQAGWQRPLREVQPAVTCTAQATLLTGVTAERHGIVGNGWFWRETGEIRFWLQSNRLIEVEPVYATARRQAMAHGRTFRCAKLFWWFNQGADVDWSITPKPHYGADGNKIFDITGTPEGLSENVQNRLGRFPFHTFWGPMAGLPSTQWIARCAAHIMEEYHPELTLVYLPHLDYDTQRLGPNGCDWPRIVGELDGACEPVFDVAKRIGAAVWIVNEYAHVQVSKPIMINQRLRRDGWLSIREGPFGEMLDTFGSKAFAVCDHQIAHVYLSDKSDRSRIHDWLLAVDGVQLVLSGEQRQSVGLDHPRAGDLILIAEPNAWFAYPFWLDERKAPDFARTVNIHAKPGYDPCELFIDPKIRLPKARIVWKLLKKRLGFRTLLDVVPLDATLVKGSHGLPMANVEDRPILIGDGVPPDSDEVPMTDFRRLLLARMGLLESM